MEYSSRPVRAGDGGPDAGALSAILLEAIVAEPDRPVGALPMLTEDERQQVLAGWGSGGADDGSDAGDLDDLAAGFDAADDAELDALLEQLFPSELPNDE